MGMETIAKLKNSLRSIDLALEYINKVKRETADDTLKRKLRNSVDELEQAKRAIQASIKDIQ